MGIRLPVKISLLTISGLMLLLALLPFPYGYYTFLRLVVTVSSGIIALDYFKNKNNLFILFGLTTLLFNPLIPVHLNRDLWAAIDTILGIIYLTIAFYYYKKGHPS